MYKILLLLPIIMFGSEITISKYTFSLDQDISKENENLSILIHYPKINEISEALSDRIARDVSNFYQTELMKLDSRDTVDVHADVTNYASKFEEAYYNYIDTLEKNEIPEKFNINSSFDFEIIKEVLSLRLNRTEFRAKSVPRYETRYYNYDLKEGVKLKIEDITDDIDELTKTAKKKFKKVYRIPSDEKLFETFFKATKEFKLSNNFKIKLIINWKI